MNDRIRTLMVTNCERKELILESMLSIRAAGFDSPLVMCDDISRGCWHTYKAALRACLERCEPADWYVIFEDDVRVASNAASWVANLGNLPTGCNLVSMYTAAPNDRPDSGQWWVEIDTPKRCYGALAFVWTRAAIESILDYDPGSDKRDGTDHWIGVWAHRNGWRILSANPSLVIHTGEVTTLPAAGRPECRQAARWRPDALREGIEHVSSGRGDGVRSPGPA